MTRVLGDHALRPFGVIATPEITTHNLEHSPSSSSSSSSPSSSSRDPALLLLATDGIFEVIGNDDAIHFLTAAATSADFEAGADLQALVDAAKVKWQGGLPLDVRRDDIAVAVAKIDFS